MCITSAENGYSRLRYGYMPLGISMVISDSDMVIQQASPGQTWCLKPGLVSVWSSPWHRMSICLFKTSAKTFNIILN